MEDIKPIPTPDYANLMLKSLGATQQMQKFIDYNKQQGVKTKTTDILSKEKPSVNDLLWVKANNPQQYNAWVQANSSERERTIKDQNRYATQMGYLGAQLNKAKDNKEGLRILKSRKQYLESSGIPTDETDYMISAYESGNPSAIDEIKRNGADYYRYATETGLIDIAKPTDKWVQDSEGYWVNLASETAPVQGYEKDKTNTTIEQYKWAYDPANKDDPAAKSMRKKFELAGIPKGMNISVSPDGSIDFTSGPLESDMPTKTNVTRFQEEQATNRSVISGLENSLDLMDKEYLTWFGRGKGAFFEMKEKAGLELNPEQKKYLGDFEEFRSSSYEDLTRYMKSMSGVAINPEEIKRNLKVLANPKDSPTSYVRKAKGIINKLKKRNRIYNDLIREGFNGDTVREVDTRLAAGKDGDAEGRLKDLKDMPEEEQYQILKQEGYI